MEQEQTKQPQIQLPPNAVPMIVLFSVQDNKENKIGIIINEHTNPIQLKESLKHAIEIVDDRIKTNPQSATPTNSTEQRHPKLSELLSE